MRAGLNRGVTVVLDAEELQPLLAALDRVTDLDEKATGLTDSQARHLYHLWEILDDTVRRG